MEKFSNDPIENVAINALPDFWPLYKLREIEFKKTTLYYFINSQKWEWEYRGKFSGRLDWGGKGVKEKIIKFLIEAKPELEREFLRAKSELDLTKKTISAL